MSTREPCQAGGNKRASGEYGVSWIARREPCLRAGTGICRPGRSRGCLCPGSSNLVTAEGMTAPSRMEQSAEVGGRPSQLVRCEVSSGHSWVPAIVRMRKVASRTVASLPADAMPVIAIVPGLTRGASSCADGVAVPRRGMAFVSISLDGVGAQRSDVQMLACCRSRSRPASIASRSFPARTGDHERGAEAGAAVTGSGATRPRR
jgi:hypothetical protein